MFNERIIDLLNLFLSIGLILPSDKISAKQKFPKL